MTTPHRQDDGLLSREQVTEYVRELNAIASECEVAGSETFTRAAHNLYRIADRWAKSVRATPASRDGAEGASTPWRWMKRGLTRTEVELQPAPSPPAPGAEPDCGYPAKVAELTAALDETTRQCQFWKELAKATSPAPDALREAWQWHGGALEDSDPDWVAETTEPTATGLAMPTLTSGLTVRTARGNQRAHKRDWIVRIDGEIYLFSESAFAALSPAPVPPADGGGRSDQSLFRRL